MRFAGSPITIDGRINEDAWRQAENAGDFLFPWWESGDKEQTEARLLWDDTYLYISFVAHDAHISASYTNRDDPVSEEDCVEAFIAPNLERVSDYFNFEINALGTLLDRSPANKRSKDWNAEGIQIVIEIDGTLNNNSDIDRIWTTEIAIPFVNFADYAQVPPKNGDTWRLNLYRCGGEINPQYSVWRNTGTAEPSFHVPEQFGTIQFIR